jgi:hypothetical protein
MEGSKQFGTGEDFPHMSPSSGKPILLFDPDIAEKFTDLSDTIANYTGKAGMVIIVNATETGLTTSPTVISSDKNYIHTQAIASILWTVNHNLGKYPSVRIKDETGHSIIGDIVDISINQLTIGFTIAKLGVAIIN